VRKKSGSPTDDAQTRERIAHGGLAHGQSLGRLGEIALVEDGIEDGNQIEVK